MNALDLMLVAALLGAGAVARKEAFSKPPAELLENLDMFDDLPYLDDAEEAP